MALSLSIPIENTCLNLGKVNNFTVFNQHGEIHWPGVTDIGG